VSRISVYQHASNLLQDLAGDIEREENVRSLSIESGHLWLTGVIAGETHHLDFPQPWWYPNKGRELISADTIS
jgi:hypothetical protein